jgi:hypothetical protein
LGGSAVFGHDALAIVLVAKDFDPSPGDNGEE